MARIKDETGKRFGSLVVVGAGPMARNLRHWVCLCDCGWTTAPISGAALRSGNTRSCGCLKRTNNAARTHGMTGHPALESYKGAKRRCLSPRCHSYPFYGGRGIKFLLPAFSEFWFVLGSAWFPGATLERVNNEGHYEIGNIRWATRAEQCLNTRNSVLLTHGGKTQNLSTWAAELGINPGSLSERVKKWGVDRALSTPKKVRLFDLSTHKEPST